MIKFRNGAFIYANGADFTCSNGYWQGIVFENAGTVNGMTINNCSFSNANTTLLFSNNDTTAYYPANITNNTFNVSLSTGRAITANNIYNYLIQNNTFNLVTGSIGILVNNHYNPVSQGSMTSQLKIIHNTFNNGYLQLYLGSLASQLTPVYVYNNYFYNTTGGWCFAGRMITGDIKYNTMQTNSSNTCFGLNQSTINLYRNFISNSSGNGILLDDSYPKMAPVKSQNNQLVWYGGLNIISSGNLDDILFDYSHASLNYGQNKFILENPASYHLYGSMPDTTGNYSNGHYLAKNNCWQSNNGLPKTYLYKVSPPNSTIPVEYLNQNYPCEQALNVLGSTINDLGDGIYDTLYFTEDITGDPTPPDEIAYNQACLYRENAAFFDAITSYKNLIDNYNNSQYLLTSLFEIYNCYLALDTSDQTHRDLIFNDLKYYLEQKIEQYWYNTDFVSNAYNLVLSCEVMIQNFNEAMTGYEFISLYHPDPDQRLLASMDYGEIQNYLNEGGSESSIPKKKVKTSILKLMDKKPYTKIVKDLFVVGNRDLHKKLNDNFSNTDELTLQSKQMVERARQNVNVSRSLTKQQREERRMEDIKLLFKEDNRYSKENTVNIPTSYSLHQNYPNPFNPITTIKYELPKDGLISLKIYDILGREIYSINEFKKAGVYDLKFDGSNFASGVYFYRLESGSFVETKKMVIVK